MQKPNKCLAAWLLGMLFTGAVAAQNSNSTLEQAIEIARASKSGELGLRPAARAETEQMAPLPKKVFTPVAHPKIWSITGVQRNLTVEVVYEGKVHALSLSKNQVRVGPWTLLRLGPDSADFAYLPKGQLLTEKTKVVEALPPTSLAEMQDYFDAPLLVASPMAAMGTGAAAVGTRPPLPLELMRPALQP